MYSAQILNTSEFISFYIEFPFTSSVIIAVSSPEKKNVFRNIIFFPLVFQAISIGDLYTPLSLERQGYGS
jgi:hypothetical protein